MKDFSIETDGVTVWINSPSCLLARFGRQGIDVHHDAETQKRAEGTECLFCTHELVTAADWQLFVAKVKEHHGIDVPDFYIPKRFR